MRPIYPSERLALPRMYRENERSSEKKEAEPAG